MKTILLSALLALSPGFISSSFAQDKRPDAPREEQKETHEREQNQPAQAQMRQEIEKHVKAAMEEAAKLEADGKRDEAEALRRQAKEKARAAMGEWERNARARGEGDAKKPDGPPRADMENKLKHLEQAISHLREAGLVEPAEHLGQLANRYRAALHGPDQPRREEARREEPRREEPRREEGRREEPRREEGRRDEPKREEPRREERREERRPDNDIEALRREIQELRQAVRQLSERKH